MSLARLFSALLLGVSLSTTQPIWAGEDKLKLPEAQVKALGIETLVIGQGDAAARRYPAQVQVPAAQMRAIASPVEGLIERVWVAPGSVVKKGQPLISIASPQALTMQREAVQANSQWTLMQQNLKRDELLFAEGLIAEARLQATRAAAQQAKAEAEERRQVLALAGVSAGKVGGSLTLSAPMDGVILSQQAPLGQRVDMAAPLMQIGRLNPLWVEIQIPVGVRLALGDGVQIEREGVKGKLIAIGQAVDAASQTRLVRAQVNDAGARLIPGQAVEVSLAETTSALPALPTGAVIRHEGKSWVMVVQATADKTWVIEPRPVKVLQQGEQTVQLEGVRTGERVIVKGVSSLKAMLAGVGKD